MKRKAVFNDCQLPPRNGTSIHKGIGGIPGSRTRSAGEVVKDASTKPFQKYRALKSDDPKTSEYAFFKKLKEGTNLRRLNIPTKKLKSCDIRERTRTVESSEKFRSPLPIEPIAHVNNVSLSSFLDNPSQKTDIQESYPEHFAGKRRKLRKWVSEFSYPEIDDMCLKGYDFVSVLLSRLFPETTVDNRFSDSKSVQMKFGCKYESEKCYQMHEMNLVELEYQPFANGSLSSWLNMPTGNDHSNYNSSTFYPNNSQFRNNISEAEYLFGGKNAVSYMSDSSMKFPFKNYEYRTASILETEPHPLLLGWDNDDKKNDNYLSITCHNEELSLCPRSSSSWADEPSMDILGCNYGSYMSSFAPCYLPGSYNHQYSEGLVVGCNKDINMEILDVHTLPLSPIANTLNPTEQHCDYGTLWNQNRFLSDGHDYPDTESTISSEVHSDIWLSLSREPYSANSHALDCHPEKEDILSAYLTEKYEPGNCPVDINVLLYPSNLVRLLTE